jgi:hypothetical protein
MNRIAGRAHEIYEARGGEEGTAPDDWLRAEREIDAESEAKLGALSSDDRATGHHRRSECGRTASNRVS